MTQLLAQAHAQIVSNPGRYVDHVYGEHEFGGTSVVYVSGVPLNGSLRIPTAEEFAARQEAEQEREKQTAAKFRLERELFEAQQDRKVQVEKAERIKDLANIQGVRSNQLLGYGLVVGLDGSGDKAGSSPFTRQSLRSMLTQLGIVVPPGTALNPKNVAAVTVHADLPPFAKPGQRIDVTVSSIGDADSLRGGSLLMSPLKGADGKVYAVAQGELVVGGLTASGADGSKVTVNIPSVGRIPNGATVERTVASSFANGSYLTLNLFNSDFTTARRVVDSINEAMGAGVARALDATSIQVSSPVDSAQRVSFVSMIENLEVTPAEAPARIVVNSRTGTVIISTQVHITPVAVAHVTETGTPYRRRLAELDEGGHRAVAGVEPIGLWHGNRSRGLTVAIMGGDS